MTVSGAEALELLLFLLLAVGAFVFLIWALVDAIRVPDDSMYRAGNKLIWVLVIVFAQLIGAIVYLAIGRPTSGGGAARASGLPPPPPPR